MSLRLELGDCRAVLPTLEAGSVAEQNGRDAILIELSQAYGALIRDRVAQRGLFASPDPCAG